MNQHKPTLTNDFEVVQSEFAKFEKYFQNINFICLGNQQGWISKNRKECKQDRAKRLAKGRKGSGPLVCGLIFAHLDIWTIRSDLSVAILLEHVKTHGNTLESNLEWPIFVNSFNLKVSTWNNRLNPVNNSSMSIRFDGVHSSSITARATFEIRFLYLHPACCQVVDDGWLPYFDWCQSLSSTLWSLVKGTTCTCPTQFQCSCGIPGSYRLTMWYGQCHDSGSLN